MIRVGSIDIVGNNEDEDDSILFSWDMDSVVTMVWDGEVRVKLWKTGVLGLLITIMRGWICSWL